MEMYKKDLQKWTNLSKQAEKMGQQSGVEVACVTLYRSIVTKKMVLAINGTQLLKQSLTSLTSEIQHKFDQAQAEETVKDIKRNPDQQHLLPDLRTGGKGLSKLDCNSLRSLLPHVISSTTGMFILRHVKQTFICLLFNDKFFMLFLNELGAWFWFLSLLRNQNLIWNGVVTVIEINIELFCGNIVAI